MSDEIQNINCPRCNNENNTWIGRDDMGVIVIHVLICDECLLIWRTTTEASFFGKTGRRKRD